MKLDAEDRLALARLAGVVGFLLAIPVIGLLIGLAARAFLWASGLGA